MTNENLIKVKNLLAEAVKTLPALERDAMLVRQAYDIVQKELLFDDAIETYFADKTVFEKSLEYYHYAQKYAEYYASRRLNYEFEEDSH